MRVGKFATGENAAEKLLLVALGPPFPCLHRKSDTLQFTLEIYLSLLPRRISSLKLG